MYGEGAVYITSSLSMDSNITVEAKIQLEGMIQSVEFLILKDRDESSQTKYTGIYVSSWITGYKNYSGIYDISF